MERETILPKAVTKGIIAVLVILISLGSLMIGDYSTGAGSKLRTDGPADAAPKAAASAAIDETDAETESEMQ